MVELAETLECRQADDRRWSAGGYFLIALAGAIFFIAFDLLDGMLFSGDPDDLMREVQIRRLLETGGWFDYSIPSIQMPEVYQSPWSRLVDLPYFLITRLLEPFIAREDAFWFASHAWPVVMAGFYMLLVVAILGRVAPYRRDLPVSALLAILIFSTYAIWEFSPGRIDHHNVQILLLLSMLYGVLRWDPAGGSITGVAAATAVAVGLETLPLVATILLALVSAWCTGTAGSRRFLQATGFAIASAAVVLIGALLPPDAYLVGRNDTFSAPYAAALFGFGLQAMVLPALFADDRPRIAGGFAFMAGGLAILLGILWCYPALVEGPLPMVAGLARTYWFDRILQEMPATVFFRTGDHKAIAWIALMLGTLALSLPAIWRSADEKRAPGLVLFAVAVAVVLLTLASNRTLRLALAILPMLFPFAIATIRSVASTCRSSPLRAGALVLAPAAIVAGFLALHAIVPRGTPGVDAYDQLLLNGCEGEDLAAFARLGTARILAPPALGLRIAAQGFPGVSVSTVPFHRASPAIGNLLSLYQAKSPEGRAPLVRDFDYLAICRPAMPLLAEADLPLYSSLLAGEVVPGLVAVPSGNDVMLFRIDHDALR